ncbi:hypothetical protein NDU88_003155 [Pleurodeles waltl]|uniref:Uncharacterized protein n=1 Tax=Pleurodeles waltl TaxID=8319 RepID=A0AAV7VDD4_PLEWA|nr:hypothetical protein NDU88_003155 [Pleurodeles waltl]
MTDGTNVLSWRAQESQEPFQKVVPVEALQEPEELVEAVEAVKALSYLEEEMAEEKLMATREVEDFDVE